MAILELERFVLGFFRQHQAALEANYPGINPRRIMQELEELAPFGWRDSLEFSSLAYLPHGQGNVNHFFEQLLLGTPLAYISRRSVFYGISFHIGPGVLIPRFETEGLVELALSEFKKFPMAIGEVLSVADVGTGSGNILLTLLSQWGQKAEGVGIDISQAALALARRNSYFLKYLLHPETKLEFILQDRFNGDGIGPGLHAIISNPPYIHSDGDRGLVHPQVIRHEPHEALFLPDREYRQWFKVLFEQSLELLYKNGIFLMEGHENHLSDLRELAVQVGFSQVECRNDLSGRPRYLKALKR